MTEQQNAGDSALPVIVSVALNCSAVGRSSVDDWEGGSLNKIYNCIQRTAAAAATHRYQHIRWRVLPGDLEDIF